MNSPKDKPMSSDYMASATEDEVYSCRIDGKGRGIRGFVGVIMLVLGGLAIAGGLSGGAGMLTLIGVVLLALAVVMFIQAVVGKCAARAMGINTPF